MELLDPKNGYTQEQKEHVFYSKTIWPGYQDNGDFRDCYYKIFKG